jgi:opine dehydrogenase
MIYSPIAIIGAGNGGRAFAAYLSSYGFDVNLVYRTPINIHEIRLSKHIISEGAIFGSFPLHMVINDYEKAMKGVKIILIVLPASVHLKTVRKMIPFLEDGQIILLNPGRTWGAIEVYNEIRKFRPELDIYVAETQTLLFTSRKIKDYGVNIVKIKNTIEYCSYPESNNWYVDPYVKFLFPQMKMVDDIRITSLNNIGAMIHPTIVLLNTGSISRSTPFKFYHEGVGPQIARMIEKVDNERLAIMQAMGLKGESFVTWAKNSYGIDAITYYDAFQAVESYRNIFAPDTLQNRYLTEDVPTGLVPLSSLGKVMGIPTPHIDALITIANALLGRQYGVKGRTVENVHLPPEIYQYREAAREIHEYILDDFFERNLQKD